MKFGILICSFLLSLPALAFADAGDSAATECPEMNQIVGGTQMTQQFFKSGCRIDVQSSVPSGLVYRDFIFNQSGTFMVFNSYGPGPAAQKTGARAYRIFPRTRNPSFSIRGSVVEVQTATPGIAFQFDLSNSRFKDLSAGLASEALAVHPDNHGGLEITQLATLWLDSGFALGQDPGSLEDGSSIFHDAQGNTCKLANTELFVIRTAQFRFVKDEDLKKFLKGRCATLHLDF